MEVKKAETTGKIYRACRDSLELSRQEASKRLEVITPERLEKIETGKLRAHPDEVLVMAETYGRPELRNYYCTSECPIGQQYVPKLQVKDLSQIIIEMLASLNTIQKKQERLIEIVADGVIEDDEVEDFVDIQKNLEKMSITVDTLELWVEQMLSQKKIDIELYEKYRNAK